MAKKSPTALKTISEVAKELELPQHVLRFWESKFTKIRPLKRGGGRRYYRPEDLALLRKIKKLLHDDGYTIKGAQNLFQKNAMTKDSGDLTINSAEQKQSSQGNINKSELQEVIEELKFIKSALVP